MPLIISIVGSMGSGKTTLAHIIHDKCYPDFDFYQLDEVEVEKLVGRSSKYFILFDDFSYKAFSSLLFCDTRNKGQIPDLPLLVL
ncbi:MAG: hypothetical protein QXH77_03880, partial [Desulfurococcaceae archaeon]